MSYTTIAIDQEILDRVFMLVRTRPHFDDLAAGSWYSDDNYSAQTAFKLWLPLQDYKKL